MKDLNQLTADELVALEPGEVLVAISQKGRNFQVLHPTHGSAGRLNDEIVIQLLTMEMAPVTQKFTVSAIDNGQPTIQTSGSVNAPPVQTVLAHLRGRPETIGQIGAMMLRQALDLDANALKDRISDDLAELKELL